MISGLFAFCFLGFLEILYFEIIIHSHAIIRSNTEIAYTFNLVSLDG